MNITCVLPGRGFSGGVRAPLRMAAELTRRGHDVQVLYRKGARSARAVARTLHKKFIVKAPEDWVGAI